MNETTFIYSLNDPITGKARYVGKAKKPKYRFTAHLTEAENGKKKNTHKLSWIRSLLKTGLRPELEILDEVPISEWEFWEREYIRVFRAIGFDLVNATPGGGGGGSYPGNKHRLGKPHTPDVIAHLRACSLGRKHTPEAREKIRRAKVTQYEDPKARLKMSQAKLGWSPSEETRKRMSEGQFRRYSV